jgi:hypothetical protein
MKKEEKELLRNISKNNQPLYNKLKCIEELSELSTILLQHLTKTDRVNEQEIIDEIGDVKIRLEILTDLFGRSKVKERVKYKLKKYHEYYTGKQYANI